MAKKKISQFTLNAVPNNLDLFLFEDNTTGLYYKITKAQLSSVLATIGTTNLAIANKTATTLDVTSDTGTDATIPQATITEAGLLNASDKIKLNNTTGTNSGDNAVNSLYSGLSSSKENAITGTASADFWSGAKTFLNFASTTLATVLSGLSVTGGSIASTDNILTAFGKLQNQINAVLGGANYQGVWNANTNSPTLVSSVGTKGYYYVVNVLGATNIDGITDWKVGDWIIFNGTAWDKVDNTDAVSSVNSQVGAVNLTTANVPDSLNKRYVTDANLVVIGNTSGINSGNETASTLGATINASANATPNDTDLVATVESSVVKKITWTNVKAFLKTYFDTIYTTTSAVAIQITSAITGKANTGAVGSTGITMSTNKLLGRSTAGVGAIEEITLGTNLSFTGTTLNASGGGGSQTLIDTLGFGNVMGNSQSINSADGFSKLVVHNNDGHFAVMNGTIESSIYLGSGNGANLTEYDSATADYATFKAFEGIANVEATGQVSITSPFFKFNGDDVATQPWVTTALNLKSDKLIVVNNQTANYQIALSDKEKLVEMEVAIPCVLTIPLYSVTPFEVGFEALLTQKGLGKITYTPSVGVTIYSKNGSLKSNGQYSFQSLINIGLNKWYLIGDLEQAGGGGSTSILTTIDFGTTALNEKTFNIVDATCTATSVIDISTYNQNILEANFGVSVDLFTECLNGSFNITALGRNGESLNGIFKIKYKINN